MQDCSNSIANALELLQSYTKPLIWASEFGQDLVQVMVHYLNQCWLIVNRTLGSLEQISGKFYFTIQKSACKTMLLQNVTHCVQASMCHKHLNTLRPRHKGRHFPNDIFKSIFLNENVWISIEISLEFVPKGPINNISALVQIMAWHCPGDKPLSEPMMVSLLTHICVTRPQWVKKLGWFIS